MQIWGEDNFANDGARDYLAMVSAKLLATVNEIFVDEERLDLDEDGEAMFMPSIELLALLCERYAVTPPRPPSIEQWRDKYLRIYDRSIDSYNSDARFKTERRKVIEKTFRWLTSLSASYWAE